MSSRVKEWLFYLLLLAAFLASIVVVGFASAWINPEKTVVQIAFEPRLETPDLAGEAKCVPAGTSLVFNVFLDSFFPPGSVYAGYGGVSTTSAGTLTAQVLAAGEGDMTLSISCPGYRLTSVLLAEQIAEMEIPLTLNIQDQRGDSMGSRSETFVIHPVHFHGIDAAGNYCISLPEITGERNTVEVIRKQRVY